MDSVFVAPAPGRRVRDEAGVLLEAARLVPRSPYWTRLIAEGDVVETKPATVSKESR